ncbi:MAG: class I SAM-dependent rRNA methyltransferase [Oligoflexia bacterium]|nr:class I SAM-dependent rRNA methyltransferase [Oligoflexia bacterium]
MNSIKKVEITKKSLNYIQSGGLWVFANEFKTKMKDLVLGEWVDFYFQDKFVGFGYVNPHSLIAGRICSFEKVNDRKLMFTELITMALNRRQLQIQRDCMRAVFAESDWLPGLVIDVYGKTVVAQSSTAGIDVALEDIIAAINEVFKPEEFVFKGDGSIRHLEGVSNFIKIIKGEDASLKNGVAFEGGVKIACDFIDGQKTGFFIDQRENRKKLKEFVKDKSVLDLCCYSGGWGLSALSAGAKSVTFVDQSKDAIELVKKGVKLNQFDTERVKFEVSDVFDFLSNIDEKYDVIICDPPAFVKSKKNLTQAEKAYLKLNYESIKSLSKDGLLVTCSCSYHMSQGNFASIIQEAFSSNSVQAQVVYQGGQSLDHPWIINRPESHYLKCLFLKTIS